ncbi:hypothetical protein [Psychrobacter halodurans]|uniref:hypothetical protein n=1 Tax=Psychrobacter halodurans TaxID=2818439 RepID=UPI00311CAFA3
MNNPVNATHHSAPLAVWLAEGQSSQRDMLASLQALKTKTSAPLHIIASHRHDRPEIFALADTVYREPLASASDDPKQIPPFDVPR